MTDTAFDFGELYREYAPMLTRQLGRSIGNREDVADIVQETFVRAVRAADRLDPDLPPGPWLLTIARRISIDVMRNRAVRTDGLARFAGRSPAHTVDGPEDRYLHRDQARAALDAVAALPERQRRILLLRNLDWTYEEIAAEEQLSVTAVKSLLNRARVAARRHYEIATGERRVPAWVAFGHWLRPARRARLRVSSAAARVADWVPSATAAAVAVTGAALMLPARSPSLPALRTGATAPAAGAEVDVAHSPAVPAARMDPAPRRIDVAIAPSGRNGLPAATVEAGFGHSSGDNETFWETSQGRVGDLEQFGTNGVTVHCKNADASTQAACAVMAQMPQPAS